MNDDELEKTKPIEKLSDLKENSSRVEKYEEEQANQIQSRVEKYDQEQMADAVSTAEEEAEEALAEKNINEAESLLKEEQETIENIQEGDEAPKEKFNLIKWFKNLPKKKKILVCVITALVIILLVTLVIVLATKKKDTTEPKKSIEESAPVQFDNYTYKDGELIFKNEAGKEIGKYTCENKDAEKCYVAYNNRDTDSLDQARKIYEKDNKVVEERMPIYNDNYVFIVDNKSKDDKYVKLYAIDTKDEELYKSAKAYTNNLVVIEDTGSEYGLLSFEDEKVETKIKPKFSGLSMTDGSEYLVANSSSGQTIIDQTGKELSKEIPNNITIKSYSKDLIVGQKGAEYNVYDYEGKEITSGYKFAKAIDGYVGLVKDGKVFVKDKDNVKYNEDGIKLRNDDYIKTYYYDEDGKPVKTKVSFDLLAKDNQIQVTTYGEDTKDDKVFYINTVEGLANKKYDYVNYFDGVLYFYSDAGKENLLGSYTCNNKNNIKTADDEYTSCMIAKDTVYEDNDMTPVAEKDRNSRIPIISSRYAYITDGSRVSLYDFVDKTKKANYNSVNTYTPDNGGKVTLSDDSFISIAKNTKGKFGVIKFENGTPTSVKSFDYTNAEMMGNFIIADEGTNEWIIIDLNKKIANYNGGKFNDKIRGISPNYDYVKTKGGSNYKIYTITGTEIKSDKDSFVYVELYKDFFAGVNKDNEVALYNYQGTKLTEGIKLSSKDYYGVTNVAFKDAQKQGSIYMIKVLNGSDYILETMTNYGDKKEEKPAVEEPKEEQPENKTE